MTSDMQAAIPAGTVIIAPKTYRNLLPYRQTGRKKETGGVLMGYKANRDVWVISTLMHPSPSNKCGRTWLQRDLAAAQEFVNRVHRQSNGQLTYLGEWHTHPEKEPRPSMADFGMLGDILTASRPAPPFLLGLILGDEGACCLWYQDIKGPQSVTLLPAKLSTKKPDSLLCRLFPRHRARGTPK